MRLLRRIQLPQQPAAETQVHRFEPVDTSAGS